MTFFALIAVASLAWVLLPGAVSAAGQVRVAVASNFLAPARALVTGFEAHGGGRVSLSSGSTGKLYAQIVNGAPFDLFLAANSREPARLERQGRAVAGTRFTYALGTLALWNPAQATFPEDDAIALLRAGRFRRLAIAHPRIAPYGAAARAVLDALGLEQALSAKLIRGENIAQAYQFVATGNAELGFVALSQLVDPARPAAGGYWRVNPGLYPPIRQQAVLLSRARDNATARGFWDYLHSAGVRATLRGYGYDTE